MVELVVVESESGRGRLLNQLYFNNSFKLQVAGPLCGVTPGGERRGWWWW